MSKPFEYLTCCIYSTAELIDALCDDAEDVTYEELHEQCEGVDEWAVSKGYDLDPEEGLTLQDDWHVGFHKSVYDGQECYYIQWSGIEHIWVRAEG